MSGPAPKARSLRQRRNRVSTQAALAAEDGGRRRAAPPLHRQWMMHPMTRRWWKDVWHSPMAAEFLKSDVHQLYILAELLNRFWWAPTTALAAEVRQHRLAFGLTPIDRRRLQWEIGQDELGAGKRVAPSDAAAASGDPRARLRAVK